MKTETLNEIKDRIDERNSEVYDLSIKLIDALGCVRLEMSSIDLSKLDFDTVYNKAVTQKGSRLVDNETEAVFDYMVTHFEDTIRDLIETLDYEVNEVNEYEP